MGWQDEMVCVTCGEPATQAHGTIRPAGFRCVIHAEDVIEAMVGGSPGRPPDQEEERDGNDCR